MNKETKKEHTQRKVTCMAVAVNKMPNYIVPTCTCSMHVYNVLCTCVFVNLFPLVSSLPPSPSLPLSLHTELVECLLSHGAMVKEKNKSGWTPLDESISYGDRLTS